MPREMIDSIDSIVRRKFGRKSAIGVRSAEQFALQPYHPAPQQRQQQQQQQQGQGDVVLGAVRQLLSHIGCTFGEAKRGGDAGVTIIEKGTAGSTPTSKVDRELAMFRRRGEPENRPNRGASSDSKRGQATERNTKFTIEKDDRETSRGGGAYSDGSHERDMDDDSDGEESMAEAEKITDDDDEMASATKAAEQDVSEDDDDDCLAEMQRQMRESKV